MQQVCNTLAMDDVDNFDLHKFLFPERYPPKDDGLTDDEFEGLREMERAWSASLPSLTIQELGRVFPEASEILKDKIEETKEYLLFCEDYLTRRIEEIKRLPLYEQSHAIVITHRIVEAEIEAATDRIARYKRDLALLPSARKKKPKHDAITPEDIEKAKRVPIPSLVKVNGFKKALCPFHADRTPSMHVYPDHAFCFVCNKRADAIDLARHLYNYDFPTAVRWLNSL